MSVQLILHPANQGPKLLLMPSLPKCSVRVRSFDRQRMKSSVCWLRVVIWIMLDRSNEAYKAASIPIRKHTTIPKAKAKSAATAP